MGIGDEKHVSGLVIVIAQSLEGLVESRPHTGAAVKGHGQKFEPENGTYSVAAAAAICRRVPASSVAGVGGSRGF
jgi:hypothetical protein